MLCYGILLLVLVCSHLRAVPAFSWSRNAFRILSRTRMPATRSEHVTGNSLVHSSDAADSDGQCLVLHTRRVRYKGKYPKSFSLKYKELQQDPATIEKVINKGSTPAGMHIPIMVQECLQFMGLTTSSEAVRVDASFPRSTKPTVVVDCTLGFGGHSGYILDALRQLSHFKYGSTLLALDQDGIEIQKAERRLREKLAHFPSPSNISLLIEHSNFKDLPAVLAEHDLSGQVEALLADLGYSSMQIDDQQRGFTYKADGPLDMRMNATATTLETAYQVLQRLTGPTFRALLEENSDEEFAQVIAEEFYGATSFPLRSRSKSSPRGKKTSNTAKSSCVGRSIPPSAAYHALKPLPQTTGAFADRVRSAVTRYIKQQTNAASSVIQPSPYPLKQRLDATVARAMQALRIEVNGEFRALEELLRALPQVLAPGGRAVVLTFHSGEDRRVKKSFQEGFRRGIYSDWGREVVRPSASERRLNPRSSCCKLRWVVRSSEQNESESHQKSHYEKQIVRKSVSKSSSL